jgi:hypothetical protein
VIQLRDTDNSPPYLAQTGRSSTALPCIAAYQALKYPC